jgi:hypothetical protein
MLSEIGVAIFLGDEFLSGINRHTSSSSVASIWAGERDVIAVWPGLLGHVASEAWSGSVIVDSLRWRSGMAMGGVRSGTIAALVGCAGIATGGVPIASAG